MSLTKDQMDRLTVAANAAVLSEVHTGCPALLTISQWALESGWGAHCPKCNCFGIKAYVDSYGTQDLMTTEYVKGQARTMWQKFATFATVYDCFEKHAELITCNRRYSDAFDQYAHDQDIAKLVYGIAPVYATDPEYATKVLSVMSRKEVLQAIGSAWKSIEVKA